ncbi:MAG: DUF4468 domain-containing protein [Prevotella sp.]|nr:DUF4468 domain-containing protein [Prevotella sp.]
MKRLIIVALLATPLLAAAQDNTWEQTEQEETPTEQKDAKYLAPDAVPIVNGKVCWKQTIEAPGKSARQIYDIVLRQLEKMTRESNQIKNSLVVLQDSAKCELGASYHEWLVFRNSALSLDRTRLNFHLLANCFDGRAEIRMTNVTYDYDEARDPMHYSAEEWIDDKSAVNKKRTRLYPISGKFRRKTIDRKDFIFSKFQSLLSENK